MPSRSTRSTATDDVAVTAQGSAPGGDTAPVSAPLAGTSALPPSVPDTAATRGLWAALVAQPGSSAASLADAAEISRPTAAKALVLLEKAALVTRTEGGRDGSKRLPDQWRPVVVTTDSGASNADPAPGEVPIAGTEEATSQEQVEPEPADSADDTDAAPVTQPAPQAQEAARVEEDEREPAQMTKPRPHTRTAKPATAAKTDGGATRLGSGQLRDMVLQFLRDHPDEDFSPSAIGKVLAHSSGAISNICGSSEPTNLTVPDEAAIVAALVLLEEEGLAARDGDGSDSATTWRIPSASSEELPPAPGAADPAAAPRQRRRPGELRARVLEFVRARPREEFSPTAVAHAVDASAGAVNNALERLVETGEVVRKADSPRRFSVPPKRR